MYTKEELIKIAKLYRKAVEAATGWRIDGVVYQENGNWQGLLLNAPEWSRRTDLDQGTRWERHPDPTAQKWLENWEDIKHDFERKYKPLSFALGGGVGGNKFAKELVSVAKELVAIDFSTNEEMNRYLDDHPNANPRNHRVIDRDRKKNWDDMHPLD